MVKMGDFLSNYVFGLGSEFLGQFVYSNLEFKLKKKKQIAKIIAQERTSSELSEPTTSGSPFQALISLSASLTPNFNLESGSSDVSNAEKKSLIEGSKENVQKYASGALIDYLKKNTKSLDKSTFKSSKLKRTYAQCLTENEAKEQLEKERFGLKKSAQIVNLHNTNYFQQFTEANVSKIPIKRKEKLGRYMGD
ncbi:hypothetical protein BpHYR1_031460 [Brachionus plicatilis]|uniref:Uncharacterized protein n=1 Tax=Brachionus plicatilis TaxID=10195 RepID=A0A3M7R549_BRAPC|nr:hypothetical protein BpHYR1_031460 [Brachionus plicatilis]